MWAGPDYFGVSLFPLLLFVMGLLASGAFGVLSFWNVPCPWHVAFSLVLSRGAIRFRGVS
jgi:hypothetical protein